MKNQPLIIGIAGGTGSGKTTVTRKVLDRLNPDDVVVLRQDFYYRDLTAFPGKTADEMLSLLEKRLQNEPDAELRVAAGEQAKITRIRLEKWLRS